MKCYNKKLRKRLSLCVERSENIAKSEGVFLEITENKNYLWVKTKKEKEKERIMLLEKLKEYAQKKGISKKMKSEILEILETVNFEDKNEIQAVVNELFNMPAEIIRDFILTLDEEKSNLLLVEIDYNQANKALHFYLIAVALHKIGNKVTANKVLEQFIFQNAFEKVVNKNLYLSLEKALSLGGADVLTGECEGWEIRNVNGFRKLWNDASGYINKDEFSKFALQWIQNNKFELTQRELDLYVKKEGQETKGDQTQNTENSPSVKEQILQELTINELFNQLSKKIKDLKKIKDERDVLLTEKEAYQNEILKLKHQIQLQQKENEKLIAEKEGAEWMVKERERQLDEHKNSLREREEEVKKYKMKLENVESAYGQAGQNEIDAILGKIKKKLADDYETYLELKDKEPDIEYYDVLMLMLDTVFKTLKKYGITF